MPRLSDNHFHRKCYFKRKQVPTQSVMMKFMSPPLAKVYFKSMNHKLRVLAGLDPPMKGGGNDWYIPPDTILEEGRVVLKPIKKKDLNQLGFNCIAEFGEELVAEHQRQLDAERDAALRDSDVRWKRDIELGCQKEWEDSSHEAALRNTARINNAFQEFSLLYRTSVTNIQHLLFDASIKDIQRMRDDTHKDMMDKFASLIKHQSTMLYDRYADKLDKEKARLKAKFIEDLEISRTDLGNKLHRINLEKHVAIEKLRHFLQCQNLACQVYVALKEREECNKEIEISKHEHMKSVKKLKEQAALRDFEIKLQQEKEIKRFWFNQVWKKKICHVVKRMQMFISYCLSSLPEHADFFLNVEKLMMLQLGSAVTEPTSSSALSSTPPRFHTPQPRPHPWYVFRDVHEPRPSLHAELCPRHCTASADQLPVVVVNQHCIYAQCDKFELFEDKIHEFLRGERRDTSDLRDEHNYTHDVPVRYTSSEQLLELKLESSLMKVLQKEMPNLKKVPVECCICRLPHCFCSPLHASRMSLRSAAPPPAPSPTPPAGNQVTTRAAELAHERQPNWKDYCDFVKSKKCQCAKTAKKHLREHLPPYMQKTSPFEQPELPNYEPCSMTKLKKLVKHAQGLYTPPPTPPPPPPRYADAAVQYTDQKFEELCTCFSDDEVSKIIKQIRGSDMYRAASQFAVVGESKSAAYLKDPAETLATQLAFSLKELLDDAPELEEIFKKTDCKMED